MEIICLKCQNLFPEKKNKKNISKCGPLKILSRVLNVKGSYTQELDVYVYMEHEFKRVCLDQPAHIASA